MPAAAAIGCAGEVGHEEEVEVRQVVRQVLAGEDQIARQAAIRRHLEAGGCGQRGRRGRRLRDRADATDARYDHQRVERVLGEQDMLEAAIERRTDLRRGDAAIGDVERHFEVAFDAVERADGQPTAHF
jgi:hypothetical protein